MGCEYAIPHGYALGFRRRDLVTNALTRDLTLPASTGRLSLRLR
jgi:hypothetical protein